MVDLAFKFLYRTDVKPDCDFYSCLYTNFYKADSELFSLSNYGFQNIFLKKTYQIIQLDVLLDIQTSERVV